MGGVERTTVIAIDGGTATIGRSRPDARELRRGIRVVLVVERATSWGGVALPQAVTYTRPRLSVRDAIVSSHPHLASRPWAIAVAERFDDPIWNDVGAGPRSPPMVPPPTASRSRRDPPPSPHP